MRRLGPSGTTALHLAVWRNHLGLVEALLAAGADPDVPDAESGWTALHRALHFGALRIARALLAAGASLEQTDWRGRAPLDLLSAELRALIPAAGPGELFAWGNGGNYALGTGATHVQLAPARLDALRGAAVVAVAAAKFHSAAVGADGALWTWGWGLGGRLGHAEAHIHGGESAVISPRRVAGLGRRRVAAVAAAKHHTLLCTDAGEAFSMGSNRHGQLGYAGDTQAEPRRVAALARARVVCVAAANKHSAAVTAGGEVYTWGSNALGQLGYGTSNSAVGAVPRAVEAMQGRPVLSAAAAKRHTLVVTAAGEVYTWGHRGVSPRRVQLAGARDAAHAGGLPLRFHRGHAEVARPAAVAVCAGAAHSSALTAAGAVLTWRSADPGLAAQEVTGGGLGGRRVVSIAAGKYRTCVVTDEGDVFSWEGRADFFPAGGGRSAGSGGARGARPGARPIPGARSPAERDAGAAGGSPGSSWGSGSRHAHPGSYFERAYASRSAEREGAAVPGPSSGLGPRPETPRAAAARAAAAADESAAPVPQRVESLKRAGAVAVGEKHSLALQRWAAAQLEGLPAVPWLAPAAAAPAAPELQEEGGDEGPLASPRREPGPEGGGAGSAAASPGSRCAAPCSCRRIPSRIFACIFASAARPRLCDASVTPRCPACALQARLPAAPPPPPRLRRPALPPRPRPPAPAAPRREGGGAGAGGPAHRAAGARVRRRRGRRPAAGALPVGGSLQLGRGPAGGGRRLRGAAAPPRGGARARV